MEHMSDQPGVVSRRVPRTEKMHTRTVRPWCIGDPWQAAPSSHASAEEALIAFSLVGDGDAQAVMWPAICGRKGQGAWRMRLASLQNMLSTFACAAERARRRKRQEAESIANQLQHGAARQQRRSLARCKSSAWAWAAFACMSTMEDGGIGTATWGRWWAARATGCENRDARYNPYAEMDKKRWNSREVLGCGSLLDSAVLRY
ncbi:hypothetical protein BD289DRAFT_232001 [Coniella lustricola]|uniref:Uncharacterized protein n=1 Tax=Coniella lustricola TaxID=2025994 RepID=A0A2T3AA89_9PEZI|nr:hypothetical protein BD289DRAFT_232001 [Coniella lustricola]